MPSRSYEQFAERVAEEQGWVVLAVSLRGCGQSDGQFSMLGWLDDVARSIKRLREEGSQRIWLVGSTTGGSLAIMAAARDPEIRGVAVMAPPRRLRRLGNRPATLSPTLPRRWSHR